MSKHQITKYFLFFLAIAVGACFSGLWAIESFRYKRPSTPEEIWQNDIDLLDAIRNSTVVKYRPLVLADLESKDPVFIGQAFYCSDCSTHSVCVATAAVVNSFVGIGGKSKCN